MGHMKLEHGFMLDPKRTVFFGLCDECAGEGEGPRIEGRYSPGIVVHANFFLPDRHAVDDTLFVKMKFVHLGNV